MKTVGIVAEYNPFHNGHRYQLERAKELTGADNVVVVMSGNFMQRGAPALVDKYARAEMALSCGASLVLELPVYFACSSAEYFARGAVCLLDRLGVVDGICFGSECGDITALGQAAEFLSVETPEFEGYLKGFLKEGYSFPKARAFALEGSAADFSGKGNLLASPNNILGIEYIKALLSLNSSMKPFTVLRKGAGYHEKILGEGYGSAAAIRQSLLELDSLDGLESQVPADVYGILKACFHKSFPVFPDELSSLLFYKLSLEKNRGYASYVDVSEDLSDRIQNLLGQFGSFTEFCRLIKSKDMTYSRISRCLLHILLDMTKENMDEFCDRGMIPYAHMLGFRKDSGDLLGRIKKAASIPLLSKLADADRILGKSDFGARLLAEDIKAAHIYDGLVLQKYHRKIKNEYSRNIVVI